MRIFVSGLVNMETTLKTGEFPINYSPIEYSFFGIQAAVSGVAYNIAKAERALGNDVTLVSMIGTDPYGDCVINALTKDGIDSTYVRRQLQETPTSLVLYDNEGKRKIYCDLKDIQEQRLSVEEVLPLMKECDIAVLCNSNINRDLLTAAREAGIRIATDVHVLSDVHDAYNQEFMECADVLFFSDEAVGEHWKDFLVELKNTYACKIIVVGRGGKGAAIYLREPDEIHEVPAVQTANIVNTVGAGDALFSAFVSYYACGYAPLDALYFAQKFASIKIGYNGAAQGFVSRDILEPDRLEKQVAFLKEVDKEKMIHRQTYITDGIRRENDAEHAWHMALMTILLSEYANEEIDVLKTVSMLLVHDLVEIDAGDTYAYDEVNQGTKAEREQKAAERIFNILPPDQAKHVMDLWQEFEAYETPEAKFAHTMDNFQPMMLNAATDGKAWEERGVQLQQILKRNRKTAEGSQALWNYAYEHFLQPNVEKGKIISS